MTWFKSFWNRHGERIIFMAIVTAFGVAFMAIMPDMSGEGKTLLIAVATLALNKARSTEKEEAPPEPTYTVTSGYISSDPQYDEPPKE